jgi:hypothetical protein
LALVLLRQKVIETTSKTSWVWCYTAVIPAPQEAESRRIAVQGQPAKSWRETLSQKQNTAGHWWFTCVILATKEVSLGK